MDKMLRARSTNCRDIPAAMIVIGVEALNGHRPALEFCPHLFMITAAAPFFPIGKSKSMIMLSSLRLMQARRLACSARTSGAFAHD